MTACSIPLVRRNNVSLDVMRELKGKLKVESDVLEPDVP
jgi:hypothetical protein